MNNILKLVVGVACSTLISMSAQAVVIGFDDITTADTASLTGNYSGLDFGTIGSSWSVVSDNEYAGTYGNGYGSVSSQYAVSNTGQLAVDLRSDSAFDFTGAYFTGWAQGNDIVEFTSTMITVEGFVGRASVGSVSMNLSSNGYDWLQADMLGVTRLVFTSSGSEKRWLMDDLTLNESVSVPEPTTIALLGLGLAGIAFRRRQK